VTAIGTDERATIPLRGAARAWTAFHALALAELRETGDASLTGIARWVVEPLSYTAVYLILVGGILGRPQAAFPLFLLCALVPWRFFSTAVGGAMSLLIRYAGPLKSYAFPREVLPLVQVAVGAVGLAAALLVFAPVMALYRVVPTLALAWLPAVLGILAVLTAGPAYLAAAFGLYFPDYRGAAQNLIRLAFFLSTALAPVADVPSGRVATMLRANPLSGVFDAFRAILIAGRRPSAVDLLYPLAAGLVLLALGLVVYRWRAPHFPKEM
jgi:homopolymeric O-antigen transport system permease protein